MHNIWCIFTGDLKKLQHNTIACIVLIGLVIVPSLYAWFNIDASWDPYGNTGNLKVAVANTDLGYRGDLFPIELNLGEQVVSALRENHQLQWIITGEADAIEGVKRGEYYAALILPDTFSTDMMSLFSGDIRKTEILYYLNEKENAIAPKITDKGADAVRKQIDTVFTETITEISLDMTKSLSSVVNQREGVQIEQNMVQAIEDAADQIDAVSAMIKSFSLMTGSLGDLLESGINLAEEGQEQVVSEKEMLAESFQSIGSLQDACENTAKGIDHALTQMNHCYLTVSDQIDQAFAILGEDTASFEKDIEETIKDVQILTSDLNTMKKNLQGFRDTLPDQGADLQGKLDQLLSLIHI